MDNSSITAKIADSSHVIVIANRIVLRRSTGKRYPPFSCSGYPSNRSVMSKRWRLPHVNGRTGRQRDAGLEYVEVLEEAQSPRSKTIHQQRNKPAPRVQFGLLGVLSSVETSERKAINTRTRSAKFWPS